MKLLNNMTVRVSWSLVLAVFATLILALSGLGLHMVRYSENTLRTFNQVNLDQQSALNQINSQMQLAQLDLHSLHARLAQAERAEVRKAVQSEAAALDETFDRLESTFQTFLSLPRQDDQAALIAAVAKDFETLLNEALIPQRQALIEGRPAAFTRLNEQVEQLTYSFNDTSAAFFEAAERDGTARYQAFLDKSMMITWLMIAALIIAALTSVVVLWGMTVNVIRPLDRLVGYFERMQQGHLAQRIPTLGSNEIGRLYASLAAMQQGLAETVITVRDSGVAIYQGTQNIARGNNDLSARSEQQAASLQEMVASMEELSVTVSQNADNASQASRLATDATYTAQQGGEVVDEVVATMHDISQGSHRVAEIIATIDSIAFQTNILALNASVEAARAGEHGRGFAVVAQEVRSLASRSGDAAREIRELIETSVSQVEAGTDRANRSGQTMLEVVTAVHRVSDIMDEIAAASAEQNQGIGQVNEAVTQIDLVTQHNASLVQQAASASNQLEAEASRLHAAVNRFQLDENAAQLDPTKRDGSGLARWMPALMPQPASVSDVSDGAPSRLGKDDEWEAF